MLVDHIGNWRRYGFGPAWEETMRWLENYAPGGSGSLADLTDGTHPLTDGFVSVATLTSRPLSGSLHRLIIRDGPEITDQCRCTCRDLFHLTGMVCHRR